MRYVMKCSQWCTMLQVSTNINFRVPKSFTNLHQPLFNSHPTHHVILWPRPTAVHIMFYIPQIVWILVFNLLLWPKHVVIKLCFDYSVIITTVVFECLLLLYCRLFVIDKYYVLYIIPIFKTYKNYLIIAWLDINK